MILYVAAWVELKVTGRFNCFGLGVMIYVLWEIWKMRCKAKYEYETMNSIQIIRIVKKQVQILQDSKRSPTF